MTINYYLTCLKEVINDIMNSEVCFFILISAFIILTSISFYKTIKEYAKYKYGETNKDDKGDYKK